MIIMSFELLNLKWLADLPCFRNYSCHNHHRGGTVLYLSPGGEKSTPNMEMSHEILFELYYFTPEPTKFHLNWLETFIYFLFLVDDSNERTGEGRDEKNVTDFVGSTIFDGWSTLFGMRDWWWHMKYCLSFMMSTYKISLNLAWNFDFLRMTVRKNGRGMRRRKKFK